MKLHQALKHKNRLAGEVSTLQETFKRENSRRSDNPSKIEAKDVFNKLLAKYSELTQIRGKIAIATAVIAPLLAELEEKKLLKNFLSGIPVREGEEIQHHGANIEPTKYTWAAFINREQLDGKLEELQREINSLQDRIDQHNAVTSIS